MVCGKRLHKRDTKNKRIKREKVEEENGPDLVIKH